MDRAIVEMKETLKIMGNSTLTDENRCELVGYAMSELQKERMAGSDKKSIVEKAFLLLADDLGLEDFELEVISSLVEQIYAGLKQFFKQKKRCCLARILCCCCC